MLNLVCWLFYASTLWVFKRSLLRYFDYAVVLSELFLVEPKMNGCFNYALIAGVPYCLP